MGADAEGFAVEVSRVLEMNINVRVEKEGSYARGRRPADKGFLTERPGLLYFNPLKRSISEYNSNHVSYKKQKQNYMEDQLSDNGHKLRSKCYRDGILNRPQAKLARTIMKLLLNVNEAISQSQST